MATHTHTHTHLTVEDSEVLIKVLIRWMEDNILDLAATSQENLQMCRSSRSRRVGWMVSTSVLLMHRVSSAGTVRPQNTPELKKCYIQGLNHGNHLITIAAPAVALRVSSDLLGYKCTIARSLYKLTQNTYSPCLLQTTRITK